MIDVTSVIDEKRREREEAYALRQQIKAQTTEEHKRSRTYGLPRRHARKLQEIRRRDQ